MHTVDTMEAVYERLAPIYDLLYGVTLEPGRRKAMTRLAPASGESILEIGVGTGLSAVAYPRGCRVVAIDLSARMLQRAHERFARLGVEHVELCRMDAMRLGFPDACFDAVYAAYVMNVVDDPVRAAREMIRVCRPSGRLVMLNHFSDPGSTGRTVDSFLGRIASRAGVKWNVDLQTFLRAAGLTPQSVERVNLPRVSSIVVCHRS